MDQAVVDEVSERSGGFCEGVGKIEDVVDDAEDITAVLKAHEECHNYATQFHHVHRRRGEDKAEQIRHLCLYCHHFIHAHPRIAYDLGSLKHSWDD
jgi:hypothetical protein